MFSWVIFSHYFSDMFQFVYISQGAAPIHPPASSAATHHSCDNAEVRIFREYFHFSYFLLFKVPAAASPVKPAVAKKPANKRSSSKVGIYDTDYKSYMGWLLLKLSSLPGKTNLCNAELSGLPPGFQGIPIFQNYLKLPMKNIEFHSNTNKD